MSLTALLLAVVLALSTSSAFYNSAMTGVFLSLALGSAAITLLVVQPSWLNLGSIAVRSLALAALDYRVMGFQPRFMVAFSFVGLSSLAVLGIKRTIWWRKAGR